jgi:hypothetical protein
VLRFLVVTEPPVKLKELKMNAAIRVGSSEFEMFHRALNVSEYRQRLSEAWVRIREIRVRAGRPCAIAGALTASTAVAGPVRSPNFEATAPTGHGNVVGEIVASPGCGTRKALRQNLCMEQTHMRTRLFLLALVAAHCNGAQVR